ncbi:class I SAM-dependent methyltransferase [bacterium]|nr:class I SAM-dependent methyltransferase [bacterium]
MEYPDFVVRFYDVIYAKIRTSVDHGYYLKKMMEANGPVLEVGVGTGRLFLDGLKKGADVYGIDLSPEMIRNLQSKLGPMNRHRVTIGDARQFKLEKKFKLIVAPFRVFSHLTSVEDQLAALNAIAQYLTPDGIFIFDLFVPNPVLCSEGMSPTVDFDGAWSPGHSLRRITSVEPDLIHQTNHVTMRHIWEEKGVTMEKTWTFPMRYFFRYELEHLIARSQLKLSAMYGDFNQGNLTNQSADFVIVCTHR